MSPFDSTRGMTGRPPSDAVTITADSALDVARTNVVETERGLGTDRPRYEEARRVYLEAARQLQNRVTRLGQRSGELHDLEEAAGLPLTDASALDLSGPEPVSADEYTAAEG